MTNPNMYQWVLEAGQKHAIVRPTRMSTRGYYGAYYGVFRKAPTKAFRQLISWFIFTLEWCRPYVKVVAKDFSVALGRTYRAWGAL